MKKRKDNTAIEREHGISTLREAMFGRSVDHVREAIETGDKETQFVIKGLGVGVGPRQVIDFVNRVCEDEPDFELRVVFLNLKWPC